MSESQRKGRLYSPLAMLIFSLLLSYSLQAKALGSKQISQGDIYEVRIVKSSEFDYASHDYYSALLELALNKTEPPSTQTHLVESSEKLVQERVLRQLSVNGSVDVFWTVTSKLREKQAIPVRVPLLNGIMGYRVSLIHQSSLSKFENINSAQNMKRLVAIQGHDWPDFGILEHNGFATLGTSKYDMIIELLKAGRVDYFPRAAHEAVVETESLNNPNIIVEPSILLYYPSYMFFFVSKSKPELAQRIEQGLNIAKKDGSFAALFKKYINFKHIEETLNLSERKIFKLENPHLSDATLEATVSNSRPLPLR
jgi:hypothetical protein|tara:strand:- start:81 stop:1013 length:933 start_codon:yes stop_codon:yes gene_type:complete